MTYHLLQYDASEGLQTKAGQCLPKAGFPAGLRLGIWGGGSNSGSLREKQRGTLQPSSRLEVPSHSVCFGNAHLSCLILLTLHTNALPKTYCIAAVMSWSKPTSSRANWALPLLTRLAAAVTPAAAT